MKYIRITTIKILFIAILSLFGLALQSDRSFATEAEVPTLFILDTCPHCSQLLEELEELNIPLTTFEVVEVSGEENKNRLYSVSENCGIETPSVPTLYIDEVCHNGRIEVLNAVKTLNGLPIETPSEPEEEIIVDSTKIDNTESEPDVTERETSEDDKIRLAEKISFNDPLQDDTEWWVILIAIAVPSTFIFATFYALKKMKL